MPTKASRSFAVGEVDEFTRSFPVVASTRNPVKGVEVLPDGTSRPRLEALESWDLRRFIENPVILWQHESFCGAIGLASNVRETERGLEMTITLASAKVEPRAEEALEKLKAKLVRGISVGFDFGVETKEFRDGVEVSVFRNNELSEASLVTIPADAGALSGDAPPTLTPEDAQRKKLSDAARNLASGRQKRMDADDVHRFDTTNRLGRAKRTQLGGIRVPARLARVGVLRYRLADGSYRRELRLPEEVFHPDSLASLKSATVTDIAHHRDFIDTNSWKDAALGHVEDVRIDENKYVVGELVINDEDTIARIDSGELADISCGYACKLEAKPGTWNGEEYDVIQRRIRHNHVAVLPPGRGRSGTDVGIRLDATDAESVEEPPTEDKEKPMSLKIIHMDGKDYEYGSELHIGAINANCAAQVAAAKAETSALQTKFDTESARFDASEKAAKKSAEEAKADKEKEKTEYAGRFKRRLRLIRSAIRALGEEEADEDDDKKMDALDALTDRALMVKVVKHLDADFDESGKSDDYVAATFDIAMKNVKRADGTDAVVDAIESVKRADARGATDDPETKARDAAVKKNIEDSRKPFGLRASQ